jgi:hypothetical protein
MWLSNIRFDPVREDSTMTSPKTIFASLLLLSLATSLGAGPLAAQDSGEEAAVREALGFYLQGHATGDREIMARAFHPEAHLTFVEPGGALRTISLEQFLSGFSGRPAPDEDQRVRTIEWVEVAGTTAVGKIILDYPTIHFVDYMSLHKVDGEWKIVHKSYHREPKG